MNRRRLCQLTAAILTSDLTTHNYVGFMKRHSDYHVLYSAELTQFDRRARGDDVMGNLTVSK